MLFKFYRMKSMELEALKARWLVKTGEEMPDEIASLPMERIRKAVTWREAGVMVGVPKALEPVEEDESSMVDWDRQDQKNGNAYGS
jgi:hypothetical protein